eukprot:TRINITY_DN2990_c0_g1_i1.p1 TRINITY_DN2990_c0_g1~~TRINITY_DN2990_c0_g1_i1.p1  ORF type:complete len:289 (+),score=51.12 TRINITY_DN2990_c0_g1_i1:75-869(+)
MAENVSNVTNEKKFAVLWCEPELEWNWGPATMYERALSAPGEKWEIFICQRMQFPDINKIQDYAGVVISGGESSANGLDKEWIRTQQQWIRDYHSKVEAGEKLPKLAAICLGHQQVCAALGGKVGKNQLSAKQVLGASFLNLLPQFATRPYMQAAVAEFGMEKMPETVMLLQAHGEEIHQLPEGAEVLAVSKDASVECMQIGSHILAWQGHPEMSRSCVLDMCLPDSMREGEYTAEEEKQIKERLQTKPDQKFVRCVIRHFLKD